jgi:hypothetical protein
MDGRAAVLCGSPVTDVPPVGSLDPDYIAVMRAAEARRARGPLDRVNDQAIDWKEARHGK